MNIVVNYLIYNQYATAYSTIFSFAVIVLSAADHVVRDFLKKADEHGYSNKEFAYIIVDLEDKLGPTPWIWQDHTGKIHNVKDMADLIRTHTQ